MGYYIQGPVHGKAEYIRKFFRGIPMLSPHYQGGASVAVCVVDNGPFEAAGIAYSLREFEAFNDPTDPRPKVWLQVPTTEVIRACPAVEEELAP